MENYTITLSNGNKATLTENNMMEIHHHYEVQCTADYLRELYPDWDEEKVQDVARETRRQMDKYGFDEEEAIEEAMSEFISEN